MFEYDNAIQIRGFKLKKTSDKCYYFRNDELELKAYIFNPGKDEFFNIINIDLCSITKIGSFYYIIYGNDFTKNKKFCF